MNSTATCDRLADHAVAAGYLAGRLTEEESADFEAHYLTCAACQEALRLGAAIRHELPAAAKVGARVRWLLIGGPVGLAAAVAGIMLLGGGPDPAITALGAVRQAPIYLGVPVRLDPATGADSLFARAMRAYVEERYADAAQGLRAALVAGVDAAPAEFFLGASLLMEGLPDESLEPLSRVIALGDTPYRSEAHYYRAKALLQQGRTRDAMVELAAVSGDQSVIGLTAGALADSITGTQRR